MKHQTEIACKIIQKNTSSNVLNEKIDLPYKSMDWFLYDKDLHHERIIKKYTKINNDLFKKVTPYSEKITHKTKLLHQITKLLHQIYFFSSNRKKFYSKH